MCERYKSRCFPYASSPEKTESRATSLQLSLGRERTRLTLYDHGLLVLLHLHYLQTIPLDELIQIVDELTSIDSLVPSMKILDPLESFVKLG